MVVIFSLSIYLGLIIPLTYKHKSSVIPRGDLAALLLAHSYSLLPASLWAVIRSLELLAQLQVVKGAS